MGHKGKFELNGYINKTFESEAYKSVKKKTKVPKEDELKPVPYFRLFQYATLSEILLMVVAFSMAILSSFCLPAINILYGEFTNMLVDRQFPSTTSTPVVMLGWFGGGRSLTNASQSENKAALLEDSVAWAIGCASMCTFQFITGAISVYLMNLIAHWQISKIRRLYFKAILSQSMAWFDTKGASNFASKLTDDLNKYEDGIGGRISIFTYMAFSFLSSVIYAFIIGWKLTLAMLCVSPILIASTTIVSKVQSSLATKELQSYGYAGTVAEEVLSAIRTVVAFDGQKKEVERYSSKLDPSVKMGRTRGIMSGIGGGLLWLITYCCYAVAFYYGVRLILWSREAGDLEYTPAVLVIVFFGVVMASTNLGHAAPHIEAFAVARGAAAAVFQVINNKSEIDPMSNDGASIDDFKGNIEINNVVFEYPGRPQVKILKGLNLTIQAGETVALVGSSGCGKSTVLQLVQRLYDVSAGQVLLDEKNIKDLNVKWVRQQLGVVGQEPMLFATTIAENIRYGSPQATMEDIQAAAMKANAHDFIIKCPQGYDTLVGQKGSTLSGGQKQRIAIARALIRNPHILLLDEATSALDAASERIVQSALDEAAKGRTTLVVTHKLSTIKNVDRIIVIADGVVAEEGTYDELVKKDGVFGKLLKAQDQIYEDIRAKKQKHEQEDTIIEDKIILESPTLPRALGTRSSMFLSVGVVPTVTERRSSANDKIAETSFKQMLIWNKPEWHLLIIGCIFSIIAGAGLPSVCVLFGELYGFLSLDNHEEILKNTDLFAALLVLAGILAGVGVFVQMYTFGLAGTRLTNRLRVKAFESMLKQEIGWHDDDRNRVGALCSRLSQDAAGVQQATGSIIGIMFQAFATMTIGAILSFFFTWKLTLVTLSTVPFVFAGVYLESILVKGQSMSEKQSLESATKVATEAINNIKAVASLSRESEVYEEYSRELQKGEKGTQRKAKVRGIAFAIGQTAPFFGYSLSLWYGGTLVANEDLHYKNVLKVSELLIFGSWMLGQSIVYAPSFGQAKMSAGRLKYLFERKPRVSDGEETEEPEWDNHGKIKYSKVRFCYPTRPNAQVLHNFDLTVNSGKSIALVGPSGCGKSTVIQLLQRLYDPTSGRIDLANKNIAHMTLSALRAQLGLVSQEPVLFNRSIRDNIAYGDNSRDVMDAEIIEAAKGANIHDFISTLPLGYSTSLGYAGAQLSGGQKQRIAIARALVRNPKILLLDEATSALDPQSEKVVQAALDKASKGRTTITIGHRLGSVLNADVIYVLDKGKVAESGTHSALMEQHGIYYGMHKANTQIN